MLKNVDHILIHTPTPQKTLQELEEVFGLKASVPMTNYGFFTSALVRFGNTDIEVLQLGEKKDFTSYLSSIALESKNEPWQTLTDLNERQITHGLPIKIKPKHKTLFLSWTTILLGGLLDNPTPIPYGFYTKNFFTKTISKFYQWLMSNDFMGKALSKDTGDSSVFFVYLDQNIHDFRKEATRDFLEVQGGGKYGLQSVESIVIEKKKENLLWDKLGKPSNENSPKLTFIEGKENKLSHIVLNASKKYNNKEIYIGDVKFVIR